MDADAAATSSRYRLPLLRSGLTFWSSAADAPRVRRPTDLALALVGVGLLVLLAAAAPGPTDVDRRVATAIAAFPGLLTFVWEAAYAALLLWACVLVVAAVVTRHRRVLLVEQLGAAVLALGCGGLIAVIEGSSWSQAWAAAVSLDSSTAYPAVRFAVVVAVVAVTAPHLARPARRTGAAVILIGGLSALMLAADTPLSLVAGLIIGVTVAAVVHLVAGSPGGHAPLEQLQAQLADLGLDLTDVEYVDQSGHQSVVARSTDADGRPLLIRIYGRDAWEASLLASLWQRLLYRQPAASAVGRQQRAEHEAFLTLFAERAGVPVEPVLAAGTAWGRDAILVRRDDGLPLAQASPGTLDEARTRAAWEALQQLHDAGLAHRDLRSSSLMLDNGDGVRITDLVSATPSATDTDRAGDRAHLLVIAALRIGIEPAVRIGHEMAGTEVLAATMPYLQSAAFDSDTRREIKSSALRIDDLRSAVATATGVEVPPLEKLRRVTWASIAMVVVLAIVAYTLIGAIAGVGLDTLIEQFQGASWWWVGAAVLLAVLIYVGQALAMQGASVDPLPFMPTVGLQTSVAFVGLAVPASAAKIGLTIRFLQLAGSNPTAAVAISLINSLSGFLVQALVIVLTLFTGLVAPAAASDGTGVGSALASIDWVVIAVLCVLLLVAAALVIRFVPRARAFVAARTAEGRASLRVLRSPRKLARIAVGSVMWNVVAALVLGCALNAFGYSVNFASLILVNTLVALFAGLVPVPGNVGVTVAALTAGLVAIGIPEAAAMSTALVYRLATYFVPALYGYASLALMRRRGYL